ncbi:MAG: DUF4910 domain-containing protein [Piscinibacter sp.]|uniref:DUF4910 domain-containing protein n=1 Tax=Piscinibacter sp. TaxID=1903157 RepID=UPI00258876AE|nr:DUF4910 domain-containing protein [Piscinibacter sp.]MCW5662483.1 DUF4910 domain-containing protein [Piscinibacter sp.]
MPPLQTIALEPAQIDAAGQRMLALMGELYPICRSITGPGVRQTLARVAREVPLAIQEVPTGTPVFDWTVPREWSIEDAWLEHESGARFAEFSRSNLHVVGYSVPVDATLTLEELSPRLHTLPEHPEWIPFRNSYYREDWGFCLSANERARMPAGRYRAVIRSRLEEGSLTLGEVVVPGESEEEVQVFAHTCHPSLCNDNLSGIVIAAELARHLATCHTRYTYRFLFAPATIGSITWMATHPTQLDKLRHGLVLAMLGDEGPFHYQRSRTGRATIDRAAELVLRSAHPEARCLEFSPWGFDERQFNSPGIRRPVGRLSRALTGEYPQEHTSADAMDLMSAQALAESWRTCLQIFEVLEHDRCWINLAPYGEPQLGRRGLYRNAGGHYSGVADRQMGLLWVLNQSDGETSLLDIAERSRLDFGLLAQCAQDLAAAGLLSPRPDSYR